jgi:hypothetical protein
MAWFVYVIKSEVDGRLKRVTAPFYFVDDRGVRKVFSVFMYSLSYK